MKYATKYVPHERIMDEFDELEINYNPSDASLPKFLEKHTNKIIIINVINLEEQDIKLMKSLYEKYGNLKLRVAYAQKNTVAAIQEAKIPFYFSNPIYSWDMLNGLLEYGPTDVLIIESLCFDIIQVAAVVHKHNAAVRVVPNYCQTSFEHSPYITQFFIRPDDIDMYNDYIDTLELVGLPNQLSVFLRVYKKEKHWHGNLREILIGFHTDVDNRGIIPTFTRTRLNCQKDCARTGNCRVCHALVSLSELIKSTVEKNKKI